MPTQMHCQQACVSTRKWSVHEGSRFAVCRWLMPFGPIFMLILSGVPCWVELPDEAWHPSANKHKFRRPVCRLVKALYGHPDAETMWEQHCHTAVQKVGFKPLGQEWPSLYFHPDLKLLLVIYVDDLKGLPPTCQKGGPCCAKNFVLKTRHRWVCLVVVSPMVRQYCSESQSSTVGSRCNGAQLIRACAWGS